MAETRASAPQVSVVVATHNRERRLVSCSPGCARRRLAARAVRGDRRRRRLDRWHRVRCSSARQDADGPRLRAIARRAQRRPRRPPASGAGARRAAPLIAFTDDDCVPDPGWLAAGLAACAADPGAHRPGATEPIGEELERLELATAAVHPHDQGARASIPASRPATSSIRASCSSGSAASTPSPSGGCTAARTPTSPGARSGRAAVPAFAPDAIVRHAVNWLGPLGKLRLAANWELQAYADHPGLRRAHFTHRVFWKPSHYLLVRALLAARLAAAAALPRAVAGRCRTCAT